MAGFCISVLCLLWRSTVDLPMYLLLRGSLFCHSKWLQFVIVALPVLLVLIISKSLTLTLQLFELHLMFKASVDIIV